MRLGGGPESRRRRWCSPSDRFGNSGDAQAVRATAADLASGRLDGVWTEVRGVVRWMAIDRATRLSMDIDVGGLLLRGTSPTSTALLTTVWSTPKSGSGACLRPTRS